jgi:hypothetical protein
VSLGGPTRVSDISFDALGELDPTGWIVRKGAPLFPKKETAS